jgi:hypothetical protein
MNRTHRWLILATIASSGAALAFAGCGDDSGTAANGGADATSDATTQDSARQDGATDATTADSGNDGSSCVPYDLSQLDASSVEAGFYAAWQVYKCQGCHQKSSQKVDDAGAGLVLSGNNDGIGDSGMVFPPNLTGDPTTGLGCWTDDQITNGILHGTDNDGGKLCPQMPKWGNMLTLPDGAARPGTPMDAGTVAQIVAFLRSLPVVNNQVTDTMCPMMGDAGMGGATDGGGTDGGDAQSVEAGGDAASVDAADAATE